MVKLIYSFTSLLWIFFMLSISGCSSSSMVDNLRGEITILASDSLEGRRTGTPGEHKAANFIASEFGRYGFRPAGENGTYFQPFEFVSSVTLGNNNHFGISSEGITIDFALDKDYRPFGFSADTSITALLAFAGYGISAPDIKYDDYGGIDVKGKIVLVMKDTPDGDQPHSPFSKYSSVKVKIMTAREKGAAGFILVSSPSSDEKDDLPKLRYDFAFTNVGLPCIQNNTIFRDDDIPPARKRFFSYAEADRLDQSATVVYL